MIFIQPQPEKGEEIRRLSGSTQVEMFRADLSDLEQTRALAKTLAERGERIDVLVDNAGVATPRSRQTPQGLDFMFATNLSTAKYTNASPRIAITPRSNVRWNSR